MLNKMKIYEVLFVKRELAYIVNLFTGKVIWFERLYKFSLGQGKGRYGRREQHYSHGLPANIGNDMMMLWMRCVVWKCVCVNSSKGH